MKKIPIKDLRDTNKKLDLCNEEKQERIEMYESIHKGLLNVSEGKIVDGPNALKELKAKYGL